ncbi:LysR substrate-binding domain-containing protein [Klebsiella pneumoniae]|uniref:LysR family transcriptional regulator n=1 Tax=Klebsiella pneumoniae TaxID=573 RepID=UPI003F547C4F
MRLDLADLRLFIAIVDTGSITGGAANAHLALASASERLRKMEAEIGVPLLHRHARGVTMTEAGEVLARHARPLLAQQQRLRQAMHAFACGQRGTLRLDPVADDPLVLIVPPARPLAEKQEVAFAAVLNEPLVALYQTSALQQHIEQHAAELGQALNVRVRMSHFAGLCEMVAHGAGGAILPRVIAERYRQRYSFAVIGLQDRWAQRRLCLCYQDDASLSPAMRRLLEWLRQP